MTARGVLLLGLLTGCTPPALAHHSGTGGDPIRIEGVVTAVEMVNPHARILVAVATGSGGPEEWQVTAAPPAELRYLGWTPSTVPVGAHIRVLGRPSGLGDRVLDLDTIEFDDGRILVASLPLALQPGLGAD